jgi:hypothetical protein
MRAMERVVTGLLALALVAGGTYGWFSTGRVLAVGVSGLVFALVMLILIGVVSVCWSLLTGRPDDPH